MSVVIAIKDKNRIVLGADKQSSVGDIKDHQATKIWEVQDLEGAIMGGVGSARASQIIQYSDIVDKNGINYEIDTKFVSSELAPIICARLMEGGICCEAEDHTRVMPNAFIFAYGDKAWMIWNDLSVSEITDTLVIGSGADVAKGVLFATKDKNPFERIVECIDAAAESTLFVDNGVDLLSTYQLKQDNQQIIKALGLEEEYNKMLEAAKQEKEAQEAKQREKEKKAKAKAKLAKEAAKADEAVRQNTVKKSKKESQSE